MLLDNYHWKSKMNLDYIYNDYIIKEKYELQLLFPDVFHKYTKECYPLYFQIVGHIGPCQLNPEELYRLTNPEEITLYSVQIYEKLEMEYFKICSQIINHIFMEFLILLILMELIVLF